MDEDGGIRNRVGREVGVKLERALLFLYAETPVHAGADTGTGVVDLPIQRDIATQLPIIKGETLKGALRQRFRGAAGNQWEQIFGSELPTDGGETQAGSLRVHEAQLVAFPAPTMRDVFVWVTSSLAQARLARKLRLAGLSLPTCMLEPSGSEGLSATPTEKNLIVGPYQVSTRHSDELQAWARELARRALPDEPFFQAKFAKDLLCGDESLLVGISRDCAPVVARVQLGKLDADGERTKTVAHGPFYSEYLPSETLMAAFLEGEPRDLDVVATLDKAVLQVGGDESTGKGLMWCRIWRADVLTS
jgi:CRISPR type III-B/RAMP module RAMP protein Cmr4